MTKKFITILVLAMMVISFSFTSMLLIPVKTSEKEETPDEDLDLVVIKYYAKPDKPDKPGKPPKDPVEPACYDFIGATWKEFNLDWYINMNGCPLEKSSAKAQIIESTNVWDAVIPAGKEIFNDAPSDSTTLYAGALDGNNVISWGDYNEDGVIAVTFIWGIFKGKPDNRKFVEYDMLFDLDFGWSLSGESGKMDLRNIAVHEFGHAAGLGDIYDDTCSEVTMYGYAGYGETKKRSLHETDIGAIQELYGAP